MASFNTLEKLLLSERILFTMKVKYSAIRNEGGKG